ncbi:hypothetical protein JCM19235_6843 [Vibrio maritimus]|uniref:Uncharacterized protein n=1 Tax=Vibrio maritimus TaxID=990268 RepID=A0A090RS89_9VIBR|nr:hypothetical protein JCM19235_6843 [Vibrio maritimus]
MKGFLIRFGNHLDAFLFWKDQFQLIDLIDVGHLFAAIIVII